VKLSHRTRRETRERHDDLPLATRKQERESTDGRGRREKREEAGDRRPRGVREREVGGRAAGDWRVSVEGSRCDRVRSCSNESVYSSRFEFQLIFKKNVKTTLFIMLKHFGSDQLTQKK
jgi:hypothetical protein